MRWPFFQKKERSLGVDLGTSSVKIVQLGLEQDSFILETYSEVSAEQTKDQTGEPTISLDEKELGEMISEAMDAAKAKPENVYMSVPIFSSFVTTLELPLMNQAELVQAIPFEARRYVPVPLEEVVLDWSVAGTQKNPDGSGMMKILLVAIPNELVQHHIRVAKAAGLKVTALEMETFALARSVVDNNETNPVCVVDIGAYSTDMLITFGGEVIVAHNIDIAGSYLTQAVARGLEVPVARAEAMKRSLGTPGSPQNLQEIAVPFFDLLAQEINWMLQEYTNTNSKKVNKIILSGGASLQPMLLEYLNKKLGVTVVLANPFRNIRVPETLSGVIKNIGPSYAVAVGLAMHQFIKQPAS